MRVTDIRSQFGRGKDVLIEFDNLLEFIQDCESDACRSDHATAQAMIYNKGERVRRGGTPWYEEKTWAETRADFYQTPQVMMQMIEECKDEIEAAIGDDLRAVPQRNIKRRLEDGNELDAEAWLNNPLECWTDIHRPNKEMRVLKLGINSSINCAKKPQHLIWRGVCAAAIVDLLAARKQYCEVYALFTVLNPSSRTRKLTVDVKIKDAATQPDIGQICYATGSIGFVRSTFVKSIGKYALGKISSGFGYPVSVGESDRFDIIINEGVYNRETTLNMVRQQLKKFE